LRDQASSPFLVNHSQQILEDLGSKAKKDKMDELGGGAIEGAARGNASKNVIVFSKLPHLKKTKRGQQQPLVSQEQLLNQEVAGIPSLAGGRASQMPNADSYLKNGVAAISGSTRSPISVPQVDEAIASSSISIGRRHIEELKKLTSLRRKKDESKSNKHHLIDINKIKEYSQLFLGTLNPSAVHEVTKQPYRHSNMT